jgi:hypothetical protein
MTEETRPFLRIVRGEPDDEELAALTAVVAGLAADPPGSKATPRSRWADRSTLVRQPPPFGPGAWQASGLPH